MENSNKLHVVVFPWLAMGHLIPFLKMSKCLARRGHLVSYISTPRNLQRLPKIPQDLAPLIRLVSIPFPKVDNLPDQAESSMDISHMKSQFLKIAFDLLQSPLATFLESTRPRPDWIIYDYASHWLPELASMTGVSKAYFSLFTAATIAFTIPPSSTSTLLLSKEEYSSTAEDLTVVPARIPFKTTIRFHPHEVSRHAESSAGIESGTSDILRFSISLQGSDVVLFRTCKEFEPEWLDLVSELYKKPVIPVGVLPPPLLQEEEDEKMGTDENWLKLKDWLDKQSVESVVYVAFGTEASLSREQVHKLALGLEQSGLPFLWVLRKPPGSSIKDATEMLPDGFGFEGHGIVFTEWVPQVNILRHPAIGGFFTHCGWNSVVEALSIGRVLILFPIMNDQGLNSRLLQEKKVGLEIPRNVKDGSFTTEAVAETLRFVVASADGEALRANAKAMRTLFGNTNRNQNYIDSFVRYLAEKNTSHSTLY